MQRAHQDVSLAIVRTDTSDMSGSARMMPTVLGGGGLLPALLFGCLAPDRPAARPQTVTTCLIKLSSTSRTSKTPRKHTVAVQKAMITAHRASHVITTSCGSEKTVWV